jgi:hypothetical protein
MKKPEEWFDVLQHTPHKERLWLIKAIQEDASAALRKELEETKKCMFHAEDVEVIVEDRTEKLRKERDEYKDAVGYGMSFIAQAKEADAEIERLQINFEIACGLLEKCLPTMSFHRPRDEGERLYEEVSLFLGRIEPQKEE